MKRLLILLALAIPCHAAWLAGWSYRAQITVTNTQGSALTSYPVQLSLTSSFPFAQALSDGSDLRVTDSDGTTIIPYTITAYDSVGKTATIWLKPASVPGSGTYTPYLYWGNPSPAAFTVPPLGPWVKANTTTAIFTSATNELAENIIFDATTSKYWFVFQFGNSGSTCSIHLAYATAPGGPWTDNGAIISTSTYCYGSPHILLDSGTYYIWYAHFASTTGIYVATSSRGITGTYTVDDTTPVLAVGTGWESSRVIEPYVFQALNGTWYMFYCGDSGSTTEQIGYATASTPAGPWTKYGGNPVVAFGAAGSVDAQTVADPQLITVGSTYYMYYACSASKVNWQNCSAHSTDLIHWTKDNIGIGYGGNANFDQKTSFRGGLARFGNSYYMVYTGNNSSDLQAMGEASQYALSTAAGYPPDQVFGFYDNFPGSSLGSHWYVSPFASAGSAAISGNVLSLSCTAPNLLQSAPAFGVGSIVETSIQRTLLGSNFAGEIGLAYNASALFDNVIRLFDNTSTSGFWIRGATQNSTSTNSNSAFHPDTNYHTQSVWFKSSSEADYKTDAANSWETITTNIPAYTMPVALECYSASGTNTIHAQWIRARPYSEPEPTSALGTAQSLGNSLFFSLVP